MDNSIKPASETRPWDSKVTKPFVRIKGLSKYFGDVCAVDDVSLDIYQGELFCLLGGSGSGKSTLLRMLAGFETPTNGSIEIDGVNMATVAANARPTNMMFQSYALFPHMSVAKNVGYGLRREGMPRNEVAKKVNSMLELVQLGGYGDRKPHQLSGGQRQRVALARSLIKRPKLLLLDEPLGALDKKLREETQFELITIQEELGITFIIVTHDQEEAMSLATRIGVMDEGKIVQVGEPREIYEFPKSKFIADFIGSINLFDARVEKVASTVTTLISGELGCKIHVSHSINVEEEQQVTFALRPEKMTISRKKPRRTTNVTKGIVEETAYLGGLTVYRVILESGMRIKVTQLNLDRLDDASITWDETVYISWSDDAGLILTS